MRIEHKCDEKYYNGDAKSVGRCCLQKKEYARFCWESHACQGHSTNPRQPKDTPCDNHLRDLPPTGDHSPIPMPLFPIAFSRNHNFLFLSKALKLVFKSLDFPSEDITNSLIKISSRYSLPCSPE